MFDKLKKKLAKIKDNIAEKLGKSEVSEAEEVKEEQLPEIVEISEEKRETFVEEAREVPKVPEEEPEVEKVEVKPPPVKVKPPKAPEIIAPEKPKEVLAPEKPKRIIRRGVKRLLGRKLAAEDIDDIVWDLQVALLESDVAVPVADHIITSMKSELIGKKIGLKEDPKKLADEVLRRAIKEVLTPGKAVNLLEVVKSKRAKGEPAVMVFLGINGHGKTTSIAKMARYLGNNGYKVVLAAADTFRAAAIEQLEIHAQRLGIEIIKQRRGADAAAVAYDAIAHAKARGMDVVLVDTAGRMQTDENLMDEMKKIVRVAKPDLVIFVGDALTGNDAVEQAKTFDETIGISGSILCKMDADARGGAALSIVHITGKPILFIGTGQGYDDLVEFDPDLVINALLGD